MLLAEEIINNSLEFLPDIIFLSFSYLALHIVNGRRYSIKKTCIISIPILLLIFSLNVLLIGFFEVKYIVAISFFTIFIPQMILSISIGTEKGWFAIAGSMNAFLVVHMVKLIEATFYSKFNSIWATYIIYIIFLPAMLYFLKAYYVKLQKLIETSLPKMIYIVILLGLAICIEIITYGLIVSDTSAHILRLDIFGIAIISIYILAVAAFYLIMKEYTKKAIEAKNQAILENGLKAVEDKLKIRDLKENQLRLLRHDMKHVLISCSSLIQQGKDDEALELMKQYTTIIDSTSNTIYTKDPILNALLDYYASLCKDNNIKFEIKINEIEEALTIPTTELCIFLSNCLDNAIKALLKLDESKRYLYFKFINNDGRLALQIKNNFNGAIVLDKNNKPTSIYDGHGIGTVSIERFAQRHGLILTYDIQENVFIINVIFSIK